MSWSVMTASGNVDSIHRRIVCNVFSICAVELLTQAKETTADCHLSSCAISAQDTLYVFRIRAMSDLMIRLLPFKDVIPGK